MKQESRAEQASVSMNARRAELATARGQLDRSRLYSGGATILSDLQASLAEHSSILEKLKGRASRLEEGARLYIEREGTVVIADDLTKLAKDLIAGGDLHQVISRARLPLEKTLYNTLRLAEKDDLPTIKEIDFERAAIFVLKRAIELQAATIAVMRRQAISELSRSLGSARATIARQLLARFKESMELADQDRGLAEQLDPAEVEFLKPRPFPTQLFSGEAISWFLECVDQGLISAEEMTAIGLG